jgi:hypothetical protein
MTSLFKKQTNNQDDVTIKSRTMASPEDPDTQLDKHWAFVKPTESDEDESFAITLYYTERKKFSKVTNVKYQKTYFDAQTKTLVIEVNPN